MNVVGGGNGRLFPACFMVGSNRLEQQHFWLVEQLRPGRK